MYELNITIDETAKTHEGFTPEPHRICSMNTSINY